jgi:hypothetical protein
MTPRNTVPRRPDGERERSLVVEKKELATWKEKGTEAVAGEDERDGGSVDPVGGSATGRSMRCASSQDEHGGVSVSVSKDGNFTHGYGCRYRTPHGQGMGILYTHG